MSVKFVLPVLFSLCLSASVNAQNDCVLKRFKLISHIMDTALSIKDVNYVNRLSEFYVIDIKINDSTGCIENIDYFKKSISSHSKGIDLVVQKIKESWKPLRCGAKRLFIPVSFMFQSGQDFDLPFEIQGNKEFGVFVNEIYIVPVSSRMN